MTSTMNSVSHNANAPGGATGADPSGLLEAYQQTFSRWLERRQEASKALLDLNGSVMAGGAPQQLLQSWADWQAGAMQRLANDLQDQIGLASAAANAFMSNPLMGSRAEPVASPQPQQSNSRKSAA